MKKIKLSASTNPPPVGEFFRYMKVLDDSSVDFIHCDVMDGKFVPSLSLSYPSVKGIAKLTTKPLDIHLMVKEPSFWTIYKYLRLKPAILTVHYEAYEDKEKLKKVLMFISKRGSKAGLSISPDTKIDEIKELVPYCGHFLVMTVKPGLSGQTIISSCISKIKELKKIAKSYGIDDITYEADGGINLQNIDKIVAAGYDMAVSGKALYVAEDKAAFVKLFTSGQDGCFCKE